MNWQRKSKIVKNNFPLKRLTTFKVGGRASLFAEVKSTAELRSLVKLSGKGRIPVFILGAGSNILVSDQGLRGLVIKPSGPFFRKVCLRGSRLCAGSAASLVSLTQAARRHGLSGLEFLSAIPGCVGGALAMNTGAWGSQISDVVEKITAMDYNGCLKEISKKEAGFSYRTSKLGKYIILSAQFRLRKAPRKEVGSRLKEYLERKKRAQDYSFPNAGCIFKNPSGLSAGRLIDLCGLKGRVIGGAVISEKHANFILNKKGATFDDIMGLIKLAQKKVREKFGIRLEPEIKIWR